MDSSPFPSNKIAHGGNHKVDNIVHAVGVNGVHHCAPFIAMTPMRIESGKVQGGVARGEGVKGEREEGLD